MKDGPDIARIASLVGDSARANMLTALMDGGALTASELAEEAGVGLPTASSHLSRLMDGGLVGVSAQGRHRYYGLAGADVASMLESIMGVASTSGPQRTRPGPRDTSMREARVCYDHLAGEMGVALLDGLLARGVVATNGEGLELSAKGAGFFESAGIDTLSLSRARRPVCRSCLDWSVRRSHLAGALGAAIYDKIIAEKWARRDRDGRAVRFSPAGREAFGRIFLS